MEATNSANMKMHFNPHRVVLITGRLPTDTKDVFYLHGISPPPIPQLPGTMDQFVQTMPNGTKFAKLTFAHSGEPFYVNAELVRAINPLTEVMQAHHPKAHATISVAGRNRFLQETVEQAKTALNAAGAGL